MDRSWTPPAQPVSHRQIERYAEHRRVKPIRRSLIAGAVLVVAGLLWTAALTADLYDANWLKVALVLYLHLLAAGATVTFAAVRYHPTRCVRRVARAADERYGWRPRQGQPRTSEAPYHRYTVERAVSEDDKPGVGIARWRVDGLGQWSRLRDGQPQWQSKPKFFRGDEPLARHEAKLKDRVVQLNEQAERTYTQFGLPDVERERLAELDERR